MNAITKFVFKTCKKVLHESIHMFLNMCYIIIRPSFMVDILRTKMESLEYKSNSCILLLISSISWLHIFSLHNFLPYFSYFKYSKSSSTFHLLVKINNKMDKICFPSGSFDFCPRKIKLLIFIPLKKIFCF
jgi:hypothetical protein